MAECGICIESFNKTKRKRIVCTFCPTDGTETPVCMSCVKTYLLQDDAPMPRCPCCRSAWNEDFLSQTFPKTWILKEYKAHREHILLDLERARLPEAQEDAGRYKRALQVIERVHHYTAPLMEQIKNMPECQTEKDAREAYYTLYKTYMSFRQDKSSKITGLVAKEIELVSRLGDAAVHSEEFSAIRKERTDIEEQIALKALEYKTIEKQALTLIHTTYTQFYNAKQPIQRRIKEYQSTREYKNALSVRKVFGRERLAGDARESRETQRSRWTFVMKCTAAGCEGFVGTNWKCGLCEVGYCKECGESKANDTEHTCDPDIRSTHQALRKEAKPCPKCGAMISKIDGCDQMWCTQCKTAFSWRTGQIETSRIHNPHYFQWMRATGNTDRLLQPPPIADGNCLNLEPEEILDQVVHYAMRRRHVGIQEWARAIRHYRLELTRLQHELTEKQDDEWRRQLRVKRLVNEITDDAWKDKLQRGEKAAQKVFAIVQVMQLFTQAGVDLLQSSLPDHADVPTILKELVALRKFCNDEFAKIENRFKNDVLRIVIPSAH